MKRGSQFSSNLVNILTQLYSTPEDQDQESWLERVSSIDMDNIRSTDLQTSWFRHLRRVSSELGLPVAGTLKPTQVTTRSGQDGFRLLKDLTVPTCGWGAVHMRDHAAIIWKEFQFHTVKTEHYMARSLPRSGRREMAASSCWGVSVALLWLFELKIFWSWSWQASHLDDRRERWSQEGRSTHLPRYLLFPEWGLDQGDRSVKSMLPQLLEGMSFWVLPWR